MNCMANLYSIYRHLATYFLLLTAVLVCVANARAESLRNDSVRYFAEVKTSFSGGQNTPFWLVSNLQGLGSIEKNNGYVRAAAFIDLDKSEKFSWSAGIDLVGGWRQTAPFSIHQLYGEIKYRCLGALLGSKEIWGEFNDPRLSSGNLLYSGNAMPIPQLRVGIFDYAPFWGTKGWLSVRGYVSFGMFTDSKWQKSWVSKDFNRNKNVLYHSKGIWLRGGNTDKFPLTATVGIEMATQFGGTAYLNTEGGEVIKLPRKLKDWLKAVFPMKGSSSVYWGEEYNIQGNMLGEYNIALSWMPKADWSIKAYYEHYFEDQSQMTFEYGWKDGLWGIEVQLPKNRFVSSFVYEYIATKDQTGAVLHNSNDDGVPEQISGRDNYYSNYIYTAWQHWGMGMGNTLVISPIYNSNHRLNLVSTRLLGHHFAFAGNPTDELSYRVLLSYTRNWGTYNRPLPEVKSNVNGLVELSWKPRKLKGWYSTIGVAGDAGKLIGKSFGGCMTIGYAGAFGINHRK